MGNTAYSPSNFTAKSGTNVTWVNKDTMPHTVTSATSEYFDSGNLNPGQTFSHSFTQAGVYRYYCALHSWMKGNVMVTPTLVPSAPSFDMSDNLGMATTMYSIIISRVASS